jgi:Rhodopirellula transposase DDE domain
MWRSELQRLADTAGVRIRVCHVPPGTSKWNNIEPRLFSFITIRWRGKPLEKPRDRRKPGRRDHHQHRAKGLDPVPTTVGRK